ncbi:MAG: anthranilate phosphoribosyltransferase [Phycisphaerae bacterium]|nr:anthranilate phosphoribosyltransferase [Phycisphaerae bacterium]
MSLPFRDILLKLSHRNDLSRAEARAAFEHIMSGAASEAHIAGLLVGLSAKGPTLDEIVGAASVMRERAISISCDDISGVVLDTCGTGGDVKGTFNISTVAAIIVAAAGVKVVKHGNRSASGNTGSADVLEYLGVKLDCSPERMRSTLDRANICFAFARNHHPAMKHVAAVRSALGIPTIFNLLGPLTNPARARHQVMGVFAAEWTEPLALALGELGSERAWVVHADDGLDELSTLGPTRISELRDGQVTTWRFDPATVGLERALLADLQVPSIEAAAGAIHEVLNGGGGVRRDIATLNAAAGLVIAGNSVDIRDGLTKAAEAIDSGRARETLQELIQSSQQ